ncbi:hypothetical protein GL213_10590 [Halogeometricum borinquense]|uniref:Uncharacterized protein n=2 Tax=Halogeometricum borinquense TaxID=60847 RepID=E4NPM7_HALBP|nr:hypothetical protein [Halogeometricum borinquense]ADQ67697.1 hypothetical protein Hbor_21330 [Halogeometricum borinquense DSM 11551]ELY23622.1 hypothetical protein C499_17764 [Halogeometricum borinquense DSM 11551]QIB73717.1 hypothetical protein G3I44_05090 [Halogeometricum borinquense]QIQ76927.1 hypothetical protein GL213_10590 [Halogeometricum borinquense]RYJ13359.1 hypothetical protein ELS19_04860 [Halogeometricum borinquense]
MSWHNVRADDRITEWERSDGTVTIRLRHSPNGTWTVRLDRLHQSDEGRGYRRERLDTEEAAREVVAAWQDEYDLEDE